MRTPSPFPHRYQPFYCEENIWWLCQDPELATRRRWVVFLSNPQGQCLFLRQRAAPPGGAVIWDYHVVLLVEHAGWWIWDLDTRLPLPAPALAYLRETFGLSAPPAPSSEKAGVPRDGSAPPGHSGGLRWPVAQASLVPSFRVVEASEFLNVFSTDRAHMKDPAGAWLKPPPPWPCPTVAGSAPNLGRFVDTGQAFLGERFDLFGFWARVGGGC